NDIIANFASVFGTSYEYFSLKLPKEINKSTFLPDSSWDSKKYSSHKFGITVGCRFSFSKKGSYQHTSIEFLNTTDFNIAQTIIGKKNYDDIKTKWIYRPIEGRRIIEFWPTLRVSHYLYGFGVKYQVLSLFKAGPHESENFGRWRLFFSITIPNDR
ncbi:MAG: hypothetical protein ACKO8Q_08015, partial [Bacteroidota bacterium]